MKDNGDLELRMYLYQDNGRAVQVGNAAVNASRLQWLPRSLIAYARKDGGEPGEAPRYVFSLPEWKVDEASLWELVSD